MQMIYYPPKRDSSKLAQKLIEIYPRDKQKRRGIQELFESIYPYKLESNWVK